MPRGGHNRKTDRQHELNGTLRHDRHGDPEQKIEFEDGLLDPPEHLEGGARKEWFRITPILKKAGLAKPAYRMAVTRYCELSGMAIEKGPTFTLDTELRQYINMLGLCPQAASKIGGESRNKPGAGKYDDV